MTALLPGAATEPATEPAAGRTGSLLRTVARQVATTLLVLGVVVLLWIAALRIWDVSPYVGKTPAEVCGTLVIVEDSAEGRTEIGALMRQTLTDGDNG